VEIESEGWKLNFSDTMQSYTLDLTDKIDSEFSFHKQIDYEANGCRVAFGVFGR
jgi:hypothetical protein